MDFSRTYPIPATVVEHRNRLASFGSEYIEAALASPPSVGSRTSMKPSAATTSRGIWWW